MEGLVAVLDKTFWKNRRVFITGHTGFKGGWLCLMLDQLGAKVWGYALKPPTNPSLCDIVGIHKIASSTRSDITNLAALKKAMRTASPEIVIHMAAQALVRESYANPVHTYLTNVMGTVNVLEAVRECKSVKAVINVTTDKCYENREWIWSYRENESLGGHDPYSSSKACSEFVTSAYRDSFFNPVQYKIHGVALASARAGNVIGGGDWALDRLVPDCIKAAVKKERIVIRNPDAVRPWQHVLEPLTGYLMLAERLYNKGIQFSEAWNFGPYEEDMKPVGWIARKISNQLGCRLVLQKIDKRKKKLHEASILRLDSTKSRLRLGWKPKWDIDKSVEQTIAWYRAYMEGRNMNKACIQQIEEYYHD